MGISQYDPAAAGKSAWNAGKQVVGEAPISAFRQPIDMCQSDPLTSCEHSDGGKPKG
jgi:hypothetical protein